MRNRFFRRSFIFLYLQFRIKDKVSFISIKENLENVRNNINKAAKDAGRDPESVTLIAVSKTKPVALLQEAYDAGIRDFGENKVQEITEKYPQLPKDIRWHMIGHLQTNKVKSVVGKVSLIESVDSERLAKEIDLRSAAAGISAS